MKRIFARMIYCATLIVAGPVYLLLSGCQRCGFTSVVDKLVYGTARCFSHTLILREDYDPAEEKVVRKAILDFPSHGCAHYFEQGGCAMCGFNKEIEKYGLHYFHPLAIVLLAKIFLLYLEDRIAEERLDIETLSVFMAGSFLNERELPVRAQDMAVNFVARSGINKLVVESRPEFVIQHLDRLKKYAQTLAGKKLEVAIGLEAVDDRIRNELVGKNISRTLYQDAVKALQQSGILSSTYILIGAPFLGIQEIVTSAVESAAFAWQSGSDVVNLETYCVQEGTPWAECYRKNRFHLPSLWDIIEIVRRLNMISGRWYLGEFSDRPQPIATPTNCPECTARVSQIIRRLREIHDISLLDNLPACACRNSKKTKREKVIIRQATENDIDNLVKLEKEVWGDEMAAGRDKWLSRMAIFHEGTNIAIRGEYIIGVVAAHIIIWDYEDGYCPTWKEATDNGYITNHRDDGNILYGVDLTVLPGQPRAADLLIKKNLEIARKRAIQTIFGCRIPSFASTIERLIGEPTQKVLMEVASKDVEIRYFMRFGFKIIQLKKDYFPQDKASQGWAAMLLLK